MTDFRQELNRGPHNSRLDLSEDAAGDWTCSCPVHACQWTSWARSSAERQRKEDAHLEQEHPETLEIQGAIYDRKHLAR